MSEEKNGRLARLFSGKKSLLAIPIALVLGILLIIWGGKEGTLQVSGRVNEPILTNATDQERRLEERVKELCERVEGVSDVNVLIVVDTISENIYAENVQTRHSDGSDEVRREFAGGSDSPIKIGERNATVRGAAVVCKGGDDPALKLKLTSLISAALGIPSSSVSVVGSG